jgi:hypothetical protein
MSTRRLGLAIALVAMHRHAARPFQINIPWPDVPSPRARPVTSGSPASSLHHHAGIARNRSLCDLTALVAVTPRACARIAFSRHAWGRKVMEWFTRTTSVAGIQIHNWVLVLIAVIIIWLIYRFLF